MQLRLKTKITLTTALLVLAVVGVNSTLYVMTLTRQVIRQANDRAQLVSRHVFFQAQNALAEAAKAGKAPASNSPEDMRAYVQESLDESDCADILDRRRSRIFPLIYEVSHFRRQRHGAGFQRRFRCRAGNRPPGRILRNWFPAAFWDSFERSMEPPRAYEVDFPFQLGPPGKQVPSE